MGKLVIGPSTGWMYANGINSLIQQQAILRDAGVGAVEICLGSTLIDNNDVRVKSLLNGDRLDFARLPYTSLHLPDYQSEIDLNHQTIGAREIVANHSVSTMVIHPLRSGGEYPTVYYDLLSRMTWKGVPFRLAIENMDGKKPDGFLIAELEHLMAVCDLDFVFDVQHAFEHDPYMRYAEDLFLAMRNKIAHLHVSGESEGSNHCLVHRSENRSAIIKFLGWVFSKIRVPIILEGKYKDAKDLIAEIEFIEKELGIQ
jgi:hypothetical protein